MTVGVVGLGLIGGSMVKAYAAAGERVLAWNRNRSMLEFAMLSGEVDGELTKESVPVCDLILICLYPDASVAWLEEMAGCINPHTLVMDCCGTKEKICEAAFPLARAHGFAFVGGHPMAGTRCSGYRSAEVNLYREQPMVIVPPRYDDIFLLDRVKELLKPAGFSHISVTTAEKHDQMIAFTSQMAHVVSSAYVKSPTALSRRGFSGGSYRDMTRVAWLNAPMWTELFLDNRDNLLEELDGLIGSLTEYRDALRDRDAGSLERLLADGKRRKEEVDG